MEDSGRTDSAEGKPAQGKRSKAIRAVPNGADGHTRVVIADDDPVILEQVTPLLAGHFEVVGRACNGHDLVDAVRRLSPDVVVADINMPLMSGIEAVRRIKLFKPDICAVMLSVYTDEAIIDAAFAAGATAYVVKLRASTELIPAIHAVLAGQKYRK